MIILQILKVIGIVLACVLGFVLLILLLVMFLPFNYSLKGKGKGADITAQAAVRWLCGFVTVMAIYEGKKISYYLRVCGIKVFKGTLGNKKEDVPSGDEASEEAESAGIFEGKDTEQEQQDRIEYDKSDYPGRKTYEKHLMQAEKEASKAKKKEKAERAAEKEQEDESRKSSTIFDKIEALAEKIRNIKEKISTGVYIIEAPVTKRAWQCVKTGLFNILGHIRPRSMKGEIEFGLEDPARTAEVYGVSSVIGSLIDDRLILIPDMEESMFRIDAVIKGRIFAGYVVLSALKILFNRDVKRVYRYIRKNLL